MVIIKGKVMKKPILCCLGLHKIRCTTEFLPSIRAKIVEEVITREECIRCKKVITREHLIWDGEDMIDKHFI